jgi:DNA-binding NtrC family response regulator
MMPASAVQETDTKPQVLPGETEVLLDLRVVFRVDRPVIPPPAVGVSRSGTQIGREVVRGVSLDDARVSRHHATVVASTSGNLRIVDHDSKNGTFVNGARVTESPLASGDVISVGDSCLVVAPRASGSEDGDVTTLVGDSASMRQARSLIARFARTSGTVLLVAETGCGKEVVARALHEASGRRGEFVAVNCAAITENLFESQLFGHEAGAFTGARAHAGFFRAAADGTLFLDEIGELPLSMQPKLLRAIQERAVVPVGSTRVVSCSANIVAATNRDLAREVEHGGFRADLLARIFETQIPLPPLRERREDILQLFALQSARAGVESPRMRHELAEALLLHAWPFNAREVLAAARNLVLAQPGGVLGIGGFRNHVASFRSSPPLRPAPAARNGPGRPNPAPTDERELERLLTEHGGSVSDVARAVGRSRRQVYRWIDKFGIRPETFRR